MARLLAFTYAGLTIGNGGSAGYHLTGKHRFSRDYERASLVFEVVAQNDDPAVFVALEQDLLEAYSTPDQALLVVLSATTRHDLDPADNTGFNARANVRKLGGVEDTARSGKYECSVTIELPASLAGRAGRRSSTVNVSTSPSGRRGCVISGTYTALSNNTAREQFEAAVDALCDGILLDLTGEWEQVGQPTSETDDQNKVIRFARAYAEIIYNQAEATANHPAIVEPSLTFLRATSSAENSQELGSAQPLIELTATYSAAIKISETTDIDALWTSTIRPYIVAEAGRYAGSTVVVVRDAPDFNPVDNTFRATVQLMADPGTKFVAARTSVSESIDHGVILKPVWDGNEYSRDRYYGPGSWARQLTRTTVVRGDDMIRSGKLMSVADHGEAPKFDGFVEVREARRVNTWNVGLPTEGSIPLRASSTTYTYVRADVRETETGPSPGGTRTR